MEAPVKTPPLMISKGFIIGKFMPLHRGHLALINFARTRCDRLSVILCYHDNEQITGEERAGWLDKELRHIENVRVIPFSYDPHLLADTSESSREISESWGHALSKIVPDETVVFSSEVYGDYLAECMNIRHVMFDEKRRAFPVSASQIKTDPFRYWEFISNAARPHYVKKITLLGTESTGKSTLAEKLAAHYNTAFVPEVAREMMLNTNDCTFEMLQQVAEVHASAIEKKLEFAYKLLFIDTDVNITKSYARFLFDRELPVTPRVAALNRSHLYIFLEPDCPFVQDGSRLSESDRDRLSEHHKKVLLENNIPFHSVSGSWENRFRQVIDLIDKC